MKNKTSLAAMATLLLVTVIGGQLGFAQLFPNAPWNRTRTVVRQSCPGGDCPTAAPQVTVFAPMQKSGVVRHWTYPGNIDDHLQYAHGVSPAGLTHEQKLSLHDSLHEGTRAKPPTVVSEATFRTPPPPIPAKKKAVSESVSESTFGLGYIEPAAKDPIPDFVLAQVDGPTEVRSEFKTALIAAIAEARKTDQITFRDSVRLRVACISPAFVERAHALAVTQLAFSGEESAQIPRDEAGVIQVDGINWEGLGKFLEVFIPLLIQLLKAFGL